MNDALIIGGRELDPRDTTPVTHTAPDFLNYKAQGVHHFDRGKPLKKVNEIVLHESVTRSAKTTIKVLKKRNLGIHLVVTETGQVLQHADLLRRMPHAGPHNGRAIGIEVTNPYYPKYLNRRTPWKEVIDADWADGDRYVVPLLVQLEALSDLVEWLTGLCGHVGREFVIPLRWPGIDEAGIAMSRIPNGKKQSPGVWAHTYWGHADGSFPLLYCWLRLVACLDARTAYDWAVDAAQNAGDYLDLSHWMHLTPPPGLTEHD